MKWDFENKLLAADTNNDNTDDVFYKFDALGRRVARTANSATTIYFQSGQQTIADYASGAAASSPTYSYIYASYIDEPVARFDGSGAPVFMHRNQQYSITVVTNGNGTMVERYAYSAYGTPTITDASGTGRTTSEISNRYLYTGREWEEAMSLYHYRARLYDNVVGRFVSRDPIGFRGGALGLQEYVGGRPIHKVDAMGLWPWSPGYCCNGKNYDAKTQGCCNGHTLYDLETECCEGGEVKAKVSIWICTRPLDVRPAWPFNIPIPGFPNKRIGHSYVCCDGFNVTCYGKQGLYDTDGDGVGDTEPRVGDPIPVEPLAVGTDCKEKLVCPSVKKSKCDNPVYDSEYDLLCREGEGTNCHEWANR